MSSSSCASNSLLDSLRQALALLRAEAPQHARLFHVATRGLAIALYVDQQSMFLAGGELSEGAATNLDVTLKIQLRTVIALLDGELDLWTAIRSGLLFVRGDVHALGRASEALNIFLHGMVRCGSAPELFEELRRHAA